MAITSTAFNSTAAGNINSPERIMAAGASGWDLATGQNWTAGAIAIPQPTNGVAGQAGLIRITAVPSSWPATGGTLKYTGGSAPVIASVPAVIPFYVQDASNVLLGTASEGIV